MIHCIQPLYFKTNFCHKFRTCLLYTLCYLGSYSDPIQTRCYWLFASLQLMHHYPRHYNKTKSLSHQHPIVLDRHMVTHLQNEARTKCHRFAGNIFKCILLNEKVWISMKIKVKFVPKGPNNNIPTVVQPARRRPLSETMMIRWLTHVCVTRPQWVKPKPQYSQKCISIRIMF